MEKIIHINDLVKRYGREKVLDNINFTIRKRDFISIIGPNGCGKSTLIKILAGLEKPSNGKIIKSRALKISFVFQDYKDSLLPWRSVYRNIALPLEIKGKSKSLIKEEVQSIIKEFNLSKHIGKFPFQLSGGLLHLTAIARALVDKPEILILDEPFKSLDFDVSQQIIKYVIRYCEKRSITTLLVSHDLDQAVFFADKILILSQAPAKIKSIINVNLPRPRKLGLLKESSFFKLKNQVLEVFRK